MLYGRGMPKMSLASLGIATLISSLEVSLFWILFPAILICLSEFKYNHCADWNLLPAYRSSETGTYNYPAAAIVANLAKETPERPALMTHSDATLLFHEMGHLFHELLSRTRYSRFHGLK
jgi:hypothetical protein